MIKGQIIGGTFSELLARKKSDSNTSLGELLVTESDGVKILLQAYDLQFGSQISQQNLELISGMHLEDQEEINFLEPKLRNYSLVKLKTLLNLSDVPCSCKVLPNFFSEIRAVKKEDFDFLEIPSSPLKFGNLRSGDQEVDVPIALDAAEVISHHVMIPATTGKGKSNLMKNLLWSIVDTEKVGILVLDPHDEYYGRNNPGLKDHEKKDLVQYYTAEEVPPGQMSLRINIKDIRPAHFQGAADFTSAQLDATHVFYNNFQNDWLKELLKGTILNDGRIHETTLAVLQRKLNNLLGIEYVNETFKESSIFTIESGESTVKNIVKSVSDGKTVIVDTSSMAGSSELLTSSILASAVLNEYRRRKRDGTLKDAPVAGIVLEEAPRVLGKDVLERGHNIFSTIAREGRKFKVGLFAITQLPSLIPRAVLANMNTKIILGIEMAQERQAIIDSAAQDLSTDARTIASLDKGEAIVSSNFAKFAIPIKIPLFNPKVEKKVLKL